MKGRVMEGRVMKGRVMKGRVVKGRVMKGEGNTYFEAAQRQCGCFTRGARVYLG